MITDRDSTQTVPTTSSFADERLVQDGRPNPSAPLTGDFVGDLVARCLKQDGTRTACVSAELSWTYADLARTSGAIAREIGRQAATNSRPVAIYARRHPSLVAAILGILRSGHPFLILDPKHPAARNQRCLQLARPAGMLSLSPVADIPKALLDELTANGPAFVQDLSAGKIAPATAEESFPGDAAQPADVMYWSFTSGTTGSPRAIIGGFGPVGHFFDWQQKTVNLSREDRFSVLSGLAHDPLLRDLLLPLWTGGTSYFPPEDLFGLPGKLYEWLQGSRITICHLTPSMGHLLMNGRALEKYGPLTALRGAFFGGDSLRAGLARDFAGCAPTARIVNCYGTSETPQVMAYHEVSVPSLSADGSGDRQKLLPVGKGIEGCQLLVLNAERKLCAVGEEGEIFVRTPYRALKVLDGENSAGGAYEANPFTQATDDLLYRTGDRGEYVADGSVRHKGRQDRQVKIRGFRIALEELEGALSQDSRISQFYIDLDDSHAEKRLILFVAARSDASLKEESVREHLQARLPGYMVPERICVVPAMPLTPNGKMDRQRLREMEAALDSRPAAAAAEENIEGTLSTLISRALFAKSIQPDTDIVRAGMNSLQAIEISCAIEEQFGLSLSAAEIVQHGTVNRLGTYIRQRKGGADATLPSAGELAAMMNVEGHALASTTDGSHGVGPKLFPKNENIFTGIKNRVFQLLARVAPDVWRVKLHRARGVHIGHNASIGYDSIVETAYPWLVSIGDDVNIGIRVTIIAHFRGMVPTGEQKYTVQIHNDAFVGPGVFILPNVIIGEGAVVAAGSVVNESVPPYTLVQGNPAKPRAKCGVPLSKAVNYAEFVAHLKPIS